MNAIAAILDVVPGWCYALAIAILLAVGVTQELRVGALKVEVAAEKSAHDKTHLDYANKALAGAADARKRESDLRNAADKIKEQKNAEINTLRADVRGLRKRLSDLPTRPTGDSGAADASFGQATAGCPGPILYRDTAEALADEAERADLIRINLKACYASWDKAVATMRGTQN